MIIDLQTSRELTISNSSISNDLGIFVALFTTMKLILAALFLPTISAFTPTSKVSAQKSSSTVVKSYENAAGATAPIGYWDPLNLTSDKSQDQFDKARVGEIKNGRAAMLGVIGYIVPEFYRFPGELAPGLKFADIPNGVDAINAIPAQVSFFPPHALLVCKIHSSS